MPDYQEPLDSPIAEIKYDQLNYNQWLRLKRSMPTYPWNVKKEVAEWYKIIDYTKRTEKHFIRCFEFNKIRMHLSALSKKHGFPVRLGWNLNFASLLYVLKPQNSVINYSQTYFLWYRQPLKRYRKLCINDIIVPETLEGGFLNILDQFLAIFGAGHVLDAAVAEGTLREMDLFENIPDWGGLHDIVIMANWDKIVPLL
jgi:hypothetical protein